VDSGINSVQGEWRPVRNKITNNKSQIPNKFQIPMSKTKALEISSSSFGSFGHWGLVLVCDLVLGIWNFIPSLTQDSIESLIYTCPHL